MTRRYTRIGAIARVLHSSGDDSCKVKRQSGEPMETRESSSWTMMLSTPPRMKTSLNLPHYSCHLALSRPRIIPLRSLILPALEMNVYRKSRFSMLRSSTFHEKTNFHQFRIPKQTKKNSKPRTPCRAEGSSRSRRQIPT